MKTAEIIDALIKGNSVTTISQKQRDWLRNQAKREGLLLDRVQYESVILDDCYYNIRKCRNTVYGYGGIIGSKVIQDKYSLERLYYIRFTDTGHTCVASDTDLRHYRDDGHKFNIINPSIILK